MKRTIESESKQGYLAIPVVQDFVAHLKALLSGGEGSFCHGYSVKQKRSQEPKPWKCHSIENAQAQYEWMGKNFEENNEILDRLSTDLRAAIAENNDLRALRTCMDILKWGGVPNGAYGLLKKYLGGELIPSIKRAVEKLTAGEVNLQGFSNTAARDDTEVVDSEQQASLLAESKGSNYRMNASFTKIYSLFSEPPFVIYDSRVSAALGLITRRFIEQALAKKDNRFTAKDFEPIMFSYLKGRGGNRNASSSDIKFKQIHPGREKDHALWNVRANWIVEAALDGINFAKETNTAKKIRAVEAALFMIGRDVSERPQ